MGAHGLLPRTLLPDDRFDWVYVVDLGVAIIVAIFFLFYFNRVFASIISYALRKYTWYTYRVYVDFKALQVSPLAGRVFFRGFRYHGRNETILINEGYITWRYWLRRVRSIDVSRKSRGDSLDGLDYTGRAGDVVNGESGSKGSQVDLPCRISVRVRGLEWFIYNRTPAYDAILESISKVDTANPPAPNSTSKRRNRLTKVDTTDGSLDEKPRGATGNASGSSNDDHRTGTSGKGSDSNSFSPVSTNMGSESTSAVNDATPTLPVAIQMLPIKLDCVKGAIVLGNQHCRSVLTAKFDHVTGFVDACRSSNLDLYKQTIDLDFKKPIIQFKPNKDFRESQLAEGADIYAREQESDAQTTAVPPKADHKESFNIWNSLRSAVPHAARSRASLANRRVITTHIEAHEATLGQQRWLGLTRYLDDEDEALEQERWKNVEYGQFPTIVDSPSIGASIRWDVPGHVSSNTLPGQGVDINGAEPPEWSIDLRVRGGEIHYGPWADRQRTELQTMFFPVLYTDATPAVPLAAGQARVSTIFKLVIEFEARTTLVIPTREESKDWKWKGRATAWEGSKAKTSGKKNRSKRKKGDKANLNPEIRPYGWLDLKVSPDSTVSLTMDMVARSSGYQTELVIDLRESEMASSVNHELLWRSQSQLVSCDLSNPLGWNTLRPWQFDVQAKKLDVFLLRDHIFLLTDLVNDWSSGPVGDYYTFVPFKYSINLQLDGFNLYLNANDSNIIDKPADVDDNTFVVVWGRTLTADISIPLQKFRPIRNEIKFNVGAHDGGFQLRTPRWNTYHSFLSDPGVASLSELSIQGSYEYFTSTSPSNTDILRMTIHGDSPRIHIFGFLIRYLMKIKDNYFGEDLHFRTLEEYQTQMHDQGRETTNNVPHTKLTNDLDVILDIRAEKSIGILPARLYSAAESISLDISSIVADLRFTNYYMDLSVSFSPFTLTRTGSLLSQSSKSVEESSPQVFIDGLEISGHRLFGLPPTEPTYVCNWDFGIGSITGECSVAFLRALNSSMRCFDFSFDDEENVLPPLNPPVIHDVTFLRLSVQPIEIWLRLEQTAFLLSTQEVTLSFNDWAGSYFSQRMNLHIGGLAIANVGNKEASHHSTASHTLGVSQAYVGATVDLHMLRRKKNFDEDRKLQQSHLRLHDSRTHRIPWLLNTDEVVATANLNPGSKVRPAAMQYPLMPEPITIGQSLGIESESLLSKSTHETSSRRSSGKSSFLSNKSSGSTHSVRRRLKSYHKSRLRKSSSDGGLPEHSKDVSDLEPRTVRGGAGQKGFAFSSPYKSPHFPLCGSQIDLQDVPSSDIQQDDVTKPIQGPLDISGNVVAREGVEQISYLIEFTEGIRAFCTSTALVDITALVDALQLEDTAALLDTLQIDTVGSAISSLRKKQNEAKIMDLNVRIPHAHVRLLSSATPDLKATRGRIGVDTDVFRVNFTARLASDCPRASSDESATLSSVHVAVGNIDCSLSTTTETMSSPVVVIRCTMSNPVLWLAFGHKSVLDAKFRDVEVLNMPEHIDSFLIQFLRETKKFQSIIHDNSRTTNKRDSQLQRLVYDLMAHPNEILDPPFLTGASYVLRSATNHLRTCDSWKMMSRLRWLLSSVSPSTKGDRAFQGHQAGLPSDAKARVIKNFEHWRAWDLTQVKDSSLMLRLYGEGEPSANSGERLSTAFQASIRVNGVRLAILIGDSPNEFTVNRLFFALNFAPPSLMDPSVMQDNHQVVAKTEIQVDCEKVTTNANWDLCDMVGKLTESSDSRKAVEEIASVFSPTSTATQSSTLYHEIHAVLSLELCVVKLDSPNLSNTLLCQGLMFSSVLLTTKPRMAMTSTMAADNVTSEIADRSRILSQSRLRSPSLFAAFDDQSGTVEHYGKFRIAASCGDLSQKILQDPLVIVETIDNFLKDEIQQIQQLATSFSLTTESRKQRNPAENEESTTAIYVTISVDSYLLSLAILPTLMYKVTGRSARSTIHHDLHQRTKTLINFDLKDHLHIFSASNRGSIEEIAALKIPPINGFLRLDLHPEQKCVELHTMVEGIGLEASAIHALMATIGRPEFNDLCTDVKREVSVVSEHLNNLFADPDPTAKNDMETDSRVLFDANILIAGFSVHAISPNSSAADCLSQLHLDFGCVQMKGTNRKFDTHLALDFPDFEIRLKTIQATLIRVCDSQQETTGDLSISVVLEQSSKAECKNNRLIRTYRVLISRFEVNINDETPRMMIDIIGHLQKTLKTIEMPSELDKLRTIGRKRLRSEAVLPASTEPKGSVSQETTDSSALFGAMYSLEVTNLRCSYNVGKTMSISPGREAEDLILSFSRIDLSTKRDNAACLLIEGFQLQMAPGSKTMLGRSSNSALLPEIVFNVAYLSTGTDRRLAFHAAGKSLDLRLTSHFILPLGDLRRSIAYAVQEVRDATADWNASANHKATRTTALFGNKSFASVLVDADFAGAVVYIEGRSVTGPQLPPLETLRSRRIPQHGRYNQFTPGNATTSTTLRAPGLAFKIEYKDMSPNQRSLSAEVKVDASSNVLHPTVVPLIMEISSSVKEIVSDPESPERATKVPSKSPKILDDGRIRAADPSAIFGNCRVNLGLRICKQEFSLTCQPITQVDAVARFEDIYVTVNTVQSPEHGQFYTLSAVARELSASVQHAYSRDPSGSFDVESIVISLMSSKHVSDANGLSVILKVSPTKAQVNARQLQDFLLFREIWAPPEIRHSTVVNSPSASTEPQAFIVQRYQQIAATAAFPWDAAAVISRLDINLDLGQSLGRSILVAENLWLSSKKSSDWKQNLCIGFDRIRVDSTGRMSGLVELQNLRIRTSIQWPMSERAIEQTPLVQASLAFDHLRVKAAFDYQAFAIANITAVQFLMYNVKDLERASSDRLVCIVRGDKMQLFGTSTSASQGLALYQAFERLIQEKQTAYETSLKDIERFLRRRSAVNPIALRGAAERAAARTGDESKIPLKLQTKVIVRLGALNLGVYPSTFFDNQIFKIEALDASAQFSVLLDRGKINSSLSLNLGQLRVALSGSNRPSTPKKLGEIAIDEVVACAVSARGGTILRVPKVVATMQTWQLPESTHIDYIFKSSFQGNIDVGWNYSRVSFIRGMFASHSRALAQRLGKPLPQSAVQISGGLQPEGGKEGAQGGQEKITAVVNVPLSKYQYTALKEPIIDTPKLTQLGDATPPLEWIGLHRERLPNLTHQIVIVSLLEVAKEVEDAYTRILGSS